MTDLSFNLNPTEEQLKPIFSEFFFKKNWLPNDSFLNQFMPRDLYENRLLVRWITLQNGDDTVFAFPVPTKADGTIVLITDKVVIPFTSNERGAFIIFLMLWTNIQKFNKKSKYRNDIGQLLRTTDSYPLISKFAIGSKILD